MLLELSNDLRLAHVVDLELTVDHSEDEASLNGRGNEHNKRQGE